MLRASLIILFICISMIALAQRPVVFINAGSRAPYGTTQELTILPNGQCNYYFKEVNGPMKDSSVFTISAAQLDSLFAKARSTGFFNLNTGYPGTKVDGVGIYISMNHNGTKKRVDVRNSDVPAINELMVWVNGMLAGKGVRIRYGQ